jgi:hypothetical protein
MDNLKHQFIVFCIKERKDGTGKADICVEGSFETKTEAEQFKSAKEIQERLQPHLNFVITSYRVQQVFYKSFVPADKKSA